MRRALRYIKNNIVHMDKSLFVVCTILVIFGLFSIVSASTRESVVTYNLTLYYYFKQHLIMLAIGVVGGFLIINIPTKWYKYFAFFLYISALGLNIATFFSGDDKGRGNTNWLTIGGFQFQPSEIAKPIIIVCLAVLFEMLYKALRNKDNPKRYNGIALIVIVMLSIPFVVYKLQGDLGTALIIGGIVGIMFLFSPLLKIDKLYVLILLTVVGSLWLAGSTLFNKSNGLSEKQNERFDNFWAPCSHYETTGYQVCNAFIAINNGGLTGLGIGNSQQKYSYIPDPHTDMIFAIIAEENGLLRCTIVFILLFYVINKILILASVGNTIMNKYICLGVATYIMLHIVVNLGGLFAIIPLTGVPLPFLSYGGTFTISLIASLALVQRIHIESKMAYEKNH